MKITESQLRNIIKKSINEIFGNKSLADDFVKNNPNIQYGFAMNDAVMMFSDTADELQNKLEEFLPIAEKYQKMFQHDNSGDDAIIEKAKELYQLLNNRDY